MPALGAPIEQAGLKVVRIVAFVERTVIGGRRDCALSSELGQYHGTGRFDRRDLPGVWGLNDLAGLLLDVAKSSGPFASADVQVPRQTHSGCDQLPFNAPTIAVVAANAPYQQDVCAQPPAQRRTSRDQDPWTVCLTTIERSPVPGPKQLARLPDARGFRIRFSFEGPVRHQH
ncbi:MAG TPA: hypothetical protein VGH34_06150 [Vicinamibacterales bacterium]